MIYRNSDRDLCWWAEVMYPDQQWKNTTNFYVYAEHERQAREKAEEFIKRTTGREVYKVFISVVMNEPLGFLHKAEIMYNGQQYVFDDEKGDEKAYCKLNDPDYFVIIHHV